MRYVTIHLQDRCGAASLRYRNGAKIILLLSRKIFVSAQEAIQFNVNIALI